MGDRFMFAGATARYLGMSKDILRRKTRAGEVPFVQDAVTLTIRYSKPALDKWMADNCPHYGQTPIARGSAAA